MFLDWIVDLLRRGTIEQIIRQCLGASNNFISEMICSIWESLNIFGYPKLLPLKFFEVWIRVIFETFSFQNGQSIQSIK